VTSYLVVCMYNLHAFDRVVIDLIYLTAIPLLLALGRARTKGKRRETSTVDIPRLLKL
jgi:hypothetical protein